MILNHFLEIVQLLFWHGLTKVFVIDVTLGGRLDWSIAVIKAGLASIVHKARVITKFCALAIASRLAIIRVATATTLSLQILGINWNGPEKDHYDNYRMKAGEHWVPCEACRRQNEEVRNYHHQVEQEVEPLESHILVNLVV